MTARDRNVLLVVGAVAAIAAFWMLALTPKRKESRDVAAQVSTAQQRLDAARASASAAATARASYQRDYATVARLGKAVPVEDDVPSLVYELETLADKHKVDFRGIKLTGSSAPMSTAAQNTANVAAAAGANGAATASASAAPAALPPGASVGPAGFPTMPFTFNFRGSYFHMEKFLRSINGLTSVDGKTIEVNGRLLTVDGVGFAASPHGFPEVDATVSATAYLLPAEEQLLNGATAAGPADGTQTASTTSSSTGTAASALIGSDK